MCHRARCWGVFLLAVGIGLILSCLFETWFIRVLIGGALIAVSLLFCQ